MKVRPHHLRCLEINEENFPDEEERAEELHISKILSYEPNDGEHQSGITDLYHSKTELIQSVGVSKFGPVQMSR